MSISVGVSGVGAVISRLSGMQQEIDSRLMDAVNISLRDVQERARAEHRFTTRTGDAERSIEKQDARKAGNSITGEVGTTRLITVYLHQGTKPHTIVPRSKQALRWATGSEFQFAKRVHHPGTKPDPFIFRAIDAEKPRIISRIDHALDEL